jgi:glycosyltransferase involved in cell wall biosynthesis
VQGLKDAVLDGRTGFLVEAGNTEGFLGRIRKMDLDREDIRSFVIEMFDWQRVSQLYEEVLGPFPSR